jgi:hypothetical protein
LFAAAISRVPASTAVETATRCQVVRKAT